MLVLDPSEDGISGRSQRRVRTGNVAPARSGSYPPVGACESAPNTRRTVQYKWGRTRMGGSNRDEELERRRDLWRQLTEEGGPREVPASLVNRLRLYWGGRGIWRDKKNLSHLAPTGVTVGVLHTGRHYEDDLSANAVLYHYPSTAQPSTASASRKRVRRWTASTSNPA